MNEVQHVGSQILPAVPEGSPLRVGVVIPVRNRPSLVLEALDTVAAQQRQPQGVAVVDDGSTDGTPGAVRGWLAHHARPGWQLLERPHAGAPAARNAGLRALGEVDAVAFLDSDDLWPADFLARACAGLERDPRLVGVIADRVTWDVAAGTRRTESLEGFARDPVLWGVRRGAAFASCALLRRQAVLEAGGWCERALTGHDTALFLRMGLRGPWQCLPGEACTMRRNHAALRCEADHIYRQVSFAACRWARMQERLLRQVAPRAHLRPRVRAAMARRWTNAGKEAWRAGRPRRALACLRQAMRWNPLYPQAWRQLVLAWRARLRVVRAQALR